MRASLASFEQRSKASIVGWVELLRNPSERPCGCAQTSMGIAAKSDEGPISLLHPSYISAHRHRWVSQRNRTRVRFCCSTHPTYLRTDIDGYRSEIGRGSDFVAPPILHICAQTSMGIAAKSDEGPILLLHPSYIS